MKNAKDKKEVFTGAECGPLTEEEATEMAGWLAEEIREGRIQPNPNAKPGFGPLKLTDKPVNKKSIKNN